jgi:hypothetical protein
VEIEDARTIAPMRSVLATAIVVALSARARANVLGGGLADTDCTVGFAGVTATAGDSIVACTDGDPTCDRDGTANGSCAFSVRICKRLASNDCTPRDVTSLALAGVTLDAPRGANACGTVDTFTVPVGSAVGATMIARDGDSVVDVDYLNLCCEDASTPFGPVRCALAVDPSVAACSRPVPVGFMHALARARTLVEQASTDPAHAKAAARHAAKALRRMHAIAHHLGKTNPCGFALGLVATEAQGVLQHARQSLGTSSAIAH